MKNKIVIWTCALGLALSSCQGFLDTSSPSTTDKDFVFNDPSTAKAALLNAYDVWRGDAYVHSSGMFYDLSAVGSDIEHHPEAFSAQYRHIPESFYPGGTSNFNITSWNGTDAWNGLYQIIGICNTLINSFEAKEDWNETVAAATPTELTDIYGQAVALRATCYWELCRFIGDVPYVLSSDYLPGSGAENRFYVYEDQLNKLIDVEPLMYRVGEGNNADVMTRTYVQGLIGRYALYLGGYATRRLDMGADFYKDVDGNTISFNDMATNEYAAYGRRADWQKFYEIGETYLKSCVENSGSVSLVEVDPRADGSNGQKFGNAFQYVFQEMHEGSTLSPESVYEIPETFGGSQCERPYAFGRPSAGGGSNAYPCKSYGQARMQASYYYGDFNPKDQRRDVTVAVTASNGDGTEAIIDWTPGSKTSGGLALNKFDENRMDDVRTEAQRQSGINCPYMRMSDIYLMLAEIEAGLGNDGDAQTYVRKVHDRAFSNAADADAAYNEITAETSNMTDVVLEERKLEFGGEGSRRWDLIRNGEIAQAAINNRAEMAAVIDGIASTGYYQFANGNVIPAYIWTKEVDADATYGYRLTTACPDETDPVLFPGWRGQNDDYESEAKEAGQSFTSPTATNVAIKGLFEYIDPSSSEAATLEADGYVKTPWGQKLVENKNDYSTYNLSGLTSISDVPVYLAPLASQELVNSGMTNGYGFPQN